MTPWRRSGRLLVSVASKHSDRISTGPATSPRSSHDSDVRCSAHDLLVAMASPPDGGGVGPWVQLIPFALVLGIFYFIILLPMRRRQKKVDEFLGSPEGRRQGRHLGRNLRQRHAHRRRLAPAADRRQGPRRDFEARRRRAIRGRRRSWRRKARQWRRIMNKNLRWRILAILAVDRAVRVGDLSRPRRPCGSASTSRAACTSCCRCRPTMRCGSRPRRRWIGCARSW